MSDYPGDGRLNLEYQRKQAKKLLRELKAGDGIAIAQFNDFHPRRSDHAQSPIPDHLLCLSEAQLVIARSLGFKTWPEMKSHAQDLRRAAEAMKIGEQTEEAIDDETPTVHIRCGDDLREGLAAAGLRGEFLTFTDPFCHGPISVQPVLKRRAAFVAHAYRAPESDIFERLKREYEALDQAARSPRVVLWFEHDSFDQLILAYLLAYFADNPPQRLELICVDQIPGVERFVGLGQLAPEVFRMLWDQRCAVTDAQMELGARIWRALCADNAAPLRELIETGLTAMPIARGALQRHLQELPDSHGLSLTQRNILKLLKSGPMTGVELFRGHQKVEPLPYLGDAMFWHEVVNLSEATTPAVEFDDVEPWPRRTVSLTPQGEAVLKGERNWLACGPAPRWVGGICIESDE